MKVLSTYRILKAKTFNEDVDESWIDWAIEMMEAGYESDNLYMLAGVTKPYNQFELQELTSRVLKDLQLDYSNKEVVLNNYVYFLLSNSIDYPQTYIKTLRELRDIYYQLGMDSRLTVFYLLYFAKSDLTVNDVQFYWEGANKENIDKIVKDHFQNWISEFKHGQSRNTA
ncbi:MAG: hypothetical protein ACJ75B_22115 [Flavisolibacter sp.]